MSSRLVSSVELSTNTPSRSRVPAVSTIPRWCGREKWFVPGLSRAESNDSGPLRQLLMTEGLAADDTEVGDHWHGLAVDREGQVSE